jgi:NAD-dependent dihydropyrimidine dehydrogenase PreA subunit
MAGKGNVMSVTAVSTWHGIPREQVAWFPTVDAEKCIGCQLCFVTCGRDVYAIGPAPDFESSVARPYNCMVGCSTCAVVCPSDAISFPSREVVRRAEHEHNVLAIVRKEAQEKRDKVSALEARNRAEASLGAVRNRARIRIAGLLGDKRLLVQLEDVIRDLPCDIVNLHLEVPTLKGLIQGAPAHLSCEVWTEGLADVTPIVAEIRKLVQREGLVWIEDSNVA